MHEHAHPVDKEQWIIWNSTSRMLAMVTIGRVEVTADGRNAWLDKPYDMVGPFSLDELETVGRIAFAACIVMSRQRWQDDQGELRREAYERRRAAQERMYEEQAQFNEGHRKRRSNTHPFNVRQHREVLSLPIDGKLEPSQIKTAFRRLAQKAHPDVGGSHEQFLRITEARNALLECAS
ncbi:MAG: J domain-containing protein [Methylophilus sp.]